jgi:hypothetical protein
VADLAVGHDVIWSNKIEFINLGLRHEFIDLDGPRALQRNVVQFISIVTYPANRT